MTGGKGAVFANDSAPGVAESKITDLLLDGGGDAVAFVSKEDGSPV